MATGVICPSPFIQSFNNAGAFNVGGSILTQVSGVNTATYQDVGLTIPLPNPIPINSRGEVSNAAGLSQQLFLTPNIAYVFTYFDKNGNQIDQAAYVNGVQVALTQTTIGTALYPQTAAEAAVPVVPANIWYVPGNVLRYGTNTNPGTTDMTTAIQAALNQSGQTGGARAYLPAGTYLVTAQLTQPANSIFYGDGSASIINSTVINTDGLLASNVANSSIRNIKVNCTGTVAGGYFGAIAYRGTTNGVIESCEVIGGYFTGILVAASATQASLSNRVVGNYIHGATVTSQDSSDIHVDCTVGFGASYNVIDGNQCFGGVNWHGISVEASTNPNIPMTKNIVCNNRIGQHAAYGIMLYTHTQQDTYCQVIGNYVENIQGTALANSTGQGIYVAGHGGVTVANNVCVNCFVLTSVNFVPGVIALTTGTGSPCTVSGNSIYDTAQGNVSGIPIAGILVSGSPTGAPNGTSITGNTISQQVAGGLVYGIQIQGGNPNVTITGNNINILNTIANSRGIFAFANGTNIANLTINGNTVVGCASRGISLEQTGGFNIINFSIAGNTVSGGAATSVPLNVTAAIQGSISGNALNATTTTALAVSAATSTTVSGNILNSSGGTTASFAGTCTGSLFDDSNVVNGGLSNTATGLQVKQRTAVSPATLTFASVIGDMSTNTAGATPWGWQCSVTGTPGTWVALVIP